MRKWYAWFFASIICPWFSHTMDVTPSCMNPTYVKSCLSQMAYFMQWLVTMYSTFVTDNVLIGCFLHFHEINPTSTNNTNHMVDLQLFASPAQSASQNLCKVISLPPRHNLKSNMPFKYFMHFTSIQMWWTNPTHESTHRNYRKCKNSLCTHHHIHELPLLSISPFTFLNSSSKSFNNMEFTLDRVLTDLHCSMFKCLTTSSLYLLWLTIMVRIFLFLSNSTLRQ